MTGIVPDSVNGGLPVGTAENPIFQPDVQNAYRPPEAFSISCTLNFLPSDCTARIAAAQINAFQAELLCLAVTLDPTGEWNCASTCNLAAAFQSYLESPVAVLGPLLSGSGGALAPITLDLDKVIHRETFGPTAGDFTAQGLKLKDLAPGTLATDAVNKSQLDVATAPKDVRLVLDGANIRLTRCNGSRILIGGIVEELPVAGVALAPTGLPINTTHFIYVTGSGLGMALVASTTAWVVDGTTGFKVMSGNPAATLVGMARTITGPAWVDDSSRRFVLSLFNQPRRASRKSFTAARSTTSGSYVEINSEIRNEWIQWGGEVAVASIMGSASNDTANQSVLTAVGWDGVINSHSTNAVTSATGLGYNCSITEPFTLTEGYHYSTLMGRVATAGTGTWFGGTGVAATFVTLAMSFG